MSKALFILVVRIARPLICLHALEQITDLDIGVAVVAVFDLAALAEQRVGFVEEQDRAAFFGGVEDPAQIFLGLADVLVHHLAEIDAIEIEIELTRQHFTGHGFAGAAGAGKQRADAQTARPRRAEAPDVVHLGPLAHLHGDLSQGLFLRVRQHEIVPPGEGNDALGKIVETRPGMSPADFPKRAAEIAAVTVRLQGFVTGAANRAGGEIELTADGV